jgi:2C-methyl-D-erythritol 2,4-cyclodiphosphate synthase
MSEEEMQKKMEFIIEQQAQFAVNIDLLREAQQRTEERLAEVAAAQAQLSQSQVQMSRAQTHMNEVVAVMAEAQERMIEAQERTDQKLAETDERLNTLINIVERHISEGHNG